MSIVVQVFSVVQVWLIGQALHAPIPAAFYWILVPLVSLLTMLPLSVNCMGVREGASVVLLAPLGVASSAALTLAFLLFALQAAVSLLGGLVYLFGRFPKPTADTSDEVDNGPVDHHSDQGRARQSSQAA